jgi:hypothetical protein
MKFKFALAALGSLISLDVNAQITCPTTANQTTPGLPNSGNVFGRLGSQWNSYFGYKVDVNSGVLCDAELVAPTVTGGVFNTPTIHDGLLDDAAISASTIDNSTFTNSIIDTTTLNSPTINDPVVNSGTFNTPTINNPSITVGGNPYTLPVDQGALPIIHVSTNAALKLLAGATGRRVNRAGFYFRGDGGSANYNWSTSNCTAADDGAQVQPTAITGCWVADFNDVTPTPMVWGAIGNGVADDRVAVQAAITARYYKDLAIGPYKYLIGSPGLTVTRPISIKGGTMAGATSLDANEYGLYAGAVNIDLLTLTCASSICADGSIIDNVFFNTRNAGASTSGAAIVNYGTFGVTMNRVRMDIGCIGLDEKLSVINKFVGGSIRRGDGTSLPADCGGVRVGFGSTGGILTDFHLANTHVDAIGEYSVRILDAGGMYITGSDFLFSLYGVQIVPGANQRVQWLTANHSYLGDTTCNTGLLIDTATASASVTGLSFNQTWTASAGAGVGCSAPGVVIQNTGGGKVNGVHFNGHRSLNNDTYGIVINADAFNVTVDNSQICGNSAETIAVPGVSYDGIAFGNGAFGAAIRNNRIGANCIDIVGTSTLQKSGIQFLGTASDIMVLGNDLRGNAVSSIGGASPTGATIIKDNTGVDTVGVNVAGSATIAAPFNPIMNITGSGATITNITGMWDGREARAYMVNGSNTFATGGTAGTNFCNGAVVAQFAVAHLFKVPGANCISVK